MSINQLINFITSFCILICIYFISLIHLNILYTRLYTKNVSKRVDWLKTPLWLMSNVLYYRFRITGQSNTEDNWHEIWNSSKYFHNKWYVWCKNLHVCACLCCMCFCVCVFAWGVADIFLYDAPLRQGKLSSQQQTKLPQHHGHPPIPLRGPQQWRRRLWPHPLRLELQLHPRQRKKNWVLCAALAATLPHPLVSMNYQHI